MSQRGGFCRLPVMRHYRAVAMALRYTKQKNPLSIKFAAFQRIHSFIASASLYAKSLKRHTIHITTLPADIPDRDCYLVAKRIFSASRQVNAAEPNRDPP